MKSLSCYLGIAKMDATCQSKVFMINSFNYCHLHFSQMCWNHVSEWLKGPLREGFSHVVCVVKTFCPCHSWMGTYFVFHERKQQNREDPAEWVYGQRQCRRSSPPPTHAMCSSVVLYGPLWAERQAPGWRRR